MEEPEYENDDLLLAIEDTLEARDLTLNENLAVKIIQLYESCETRHGNMLVGKTLSGKSTAWKILAESLNLLSSQKHDEMKYPKVKYEVLNPKSVNNNELYGWLDDTQ